MIASQNFHTPSRRARHQPRPVAHQHAHADRMKTVHILFRGHRFEHALRIDLRRQRKLHQNSIHIIVAVQIGNQLQHVIRCGVCWRCVQPARHTQLLACRHFTFYIQLRSGIFANQYRCQSGPHSLCRQLRNFYFQFCKNLVADFNSIQNACGHTKSIA